MYYFDHNSCNYFSRINRGVLNFLGYEITRGAGEPDVDASVLPRSYVRSSRLIVRTDENESRTFRSHLLSVRPMAPS